MLAAFAISLFVFAPIASAQDAPDRFADRALPEAVSGLKLDSPVTVDGVSASALDASLVGATGPQRVIVRLSMDSLADSGVATPGAQTRHVRNVKAQQKAFERRVAKIDKNASSLGSAQRVLNAVFLEVDGSALAAIAADAAVERVAPVGNYELDLSSTVPYIGAAAVQAGGVDGSGVTVAVIDSGVDYYHEDLGGTGAAAYAADNPDIIEPGTFPTAKVVDGFDFVGTAWTPGGPAELPDPDPLDKPTFGDGHGTHVADIIGGVNGVAPGASIVAIKACSSVSSSCSGIALIQSMDFAADPNGDGKTKDAVDVINMSLGSVYGQPFDDDLSQAVEGATALGILTVASAGNSADKPYITGTPSATPSALSVAQTQVPSASLQLLDVTAPAGSAGQYPAVFQSWAAPLVTRIPAAGSLPIQYGDGLGGNLNGCAPFTPGTATGKIVLVDRGACFFSTKIQNIDADGGVAGIIGLVAPGAPFDGGFGGGPFPTIPGYMISQADSNTIKAGLPATAGFLDPANQLPLIGQMVGSSSRGPSNFYQQIKPEIGAPGASVSAVAGTGTGTSAFGGTSGAAPMVSGAAALLLDGFATNQKSNGKGNANGLALSPAETKALLMNNAETNIDIDPFSGLAEITRIGGGEVRVDRAIAAPAAAWDADTNQGALSFGMHEVDGVTTLTKTVRVHNYSNEWHTYTITPTFRYGSDATGAVIPSAPASVTINPGLGNDSFFDITLTIDGSLLPGNFMNSGSEGANGGALTANEFDGYLVLDNGDGHVMNIPWQVLPRQAANVVPATPNFPSGFPATVGLTNTGAGTAQLDSYSLLALSPDVPEGAAGGQSPTPDIKAVGINTIPVPAGFCSGAPSFLWLFAIDTWEDQTHLLPVSHQVSLDTNQDGTADFIVLNRDLSFTGASDGRQVTWAFNTITGSASAFFFTEHATNTGNTVLIICAEQIGLSGADLLATNVDMSVFAQDFYFGGPGDTVGGITVTPLGEQYFGVPSGDIAGGGAGFIDIFDFGPFPGNTPELGVMLLTNGDRGAGARGGATDATDTVVLVTP